MIGPFKVLAGVHRSFTHLGCVYLTCTGLIIHTHLKIAKLVATVQQNLWRHLKICRAQMCVQNGMDMGSLRT